MSPPGGTARDALQEVMGALPGADRSVPPDLQVVDRTDVDGYVRHEISYASEPGDRVPAWLLVPRGLGSPAPAVLCLHQTVPIGKDEPVGLGGRADLRYAAELAGRGYVTLAPDYPGFGGYAADPYALGYASASMKAVWNNIAALDLLCSLPEVHPRRLAAVGHSLGGHNAIFTALLDRRVRAVVSSCGFTSFARYAGGDLSGWSHRGYMPRIAACYGADPARMPFDFPDLLAALAPAAVFVNAPVRDGNFAVDGVRECIAAALPAYRAFGAEVADRLVARYPDAGHEFPAAVRAQAYGFLDRHLRPGPP